MESCDFEAYAKRMKDEEKRNKNSSPSDQISVTFESDFLVSEVSSVVSDEADSSSNYGVGSDLEVVDEMEARLGLDCRNKAEKKLVRDNKMEDATVVIS